LVNERNKYAHGALFMSVQDGRLRPLLKHIMADRTDDEALTMDELRGITDKIGTLILRFGELRDRVLDAAT
jgi:hypothetical protein